MSEFEFQLLVKQLKSQSVVWRGAIVLDGCAVFGGGVAFVVLLIVLRKIVGQPAHVFVAVGFSQYGCCGD